MSKATLDETILDADPEEVSEETTTATAAETKHCPMCGHLINIADWNTHFYFAHRM